MEDHRSKDLNLVGRTILVAPSAPRELVVGLERYGARVITWPEFEIAEPESFSAFDEAIANLFGYDWLVFRSGDAAECFLRRFQKLGHEISELDTLRVCAKGDATVDRLEASHVHIDLIPGSTDSKTIVEAVGNYVGGREALGRLNFLIPRASTARGELCDLLEEAGARVDVVIAYRTVSNNSTLAQLSALLAGGAIDGVAFDSPFSARNLAELFDALELANLLAGIRVFTFDESTTNAATDYGLRPLLSPEPTTRAMADAMAEHIHDFK